MLDKDAYMHAAHWLASGDDTPEHAYRWWAASGLALLPAGRIWDAVKIALGEVTAILGLVPGPVLCDPDRNVAYVLVPPGTADVWDLPGTVALGDGAWVVVPDPGIEHPDRAHWLRIPDGTGTLTDPALLRDVLAATSVPAR